MFHAALLLRHCSLKLSINRFRLSLIYRGGSPNEYRAPIAFGGHEIAVTL